MGTSSGLFKIGSYRPIYLWGGPGTIRMNRLKFMDQAVDEEAHHQVHHETGAQRVLEELYCNWVHLMYNWGFPPEVEQEDWEDFARAAEVYHRRGSKVFAYVQSSNCVFDGSFRQKEWYALDHRGRKIFYYSGRYMACLTHPEWVGHLKEIIRGAIERGADGIFFDNMWHGEMPFPLFDAWLGAAGCFCERCKADYGEASGSPIPTAIVPYDPAVENYLRWRADRVTQLIADLSGYANELQPGTPVSANDYDIVMLDGYLVYGQDARALARTKDVTMVENFALPRWDGWDKPRLANNALTIRNSLPLIGGAHLSVLSYDVGIGFDPIYEPRRYQQGIAEAAACGASMTTKGTEYYQDGQHTTLTPPAFEPTRKAIGKYNRWLDHHQDLYQGDRRSAASVGLLYPVERLWLKWHQLAPTYLGACQALLVEGIPWRAVTHQDQFEGLKVLLVFDPHDLDGLPIPSDLEIMQVTNLNGWAIKPLSLVARIPALRSIISQLAHSLVNAYMGSRTARAIFDRIGLYKLYTQTPLYLLPDEAARRSLVGALPEGLYPRLQAPEPALIEVWERDGRTQVHLMNYAAEHQTVRVDFGKTVRVKALSPDEELELEYSGDVLEIPLDVYQVLLVMS